MEPTANFEQVSPETARSWLETNVRNRPLSRPEMARIRSAMKEGRWVINGDAIRFDTDGILIDGQKRLTAVSLGEQTYTMLVVRNLPPLAFETIDQPQRRTAGNVLSIAKVTNSNTVASGAYLAMSFIESGDPFFKIGSARPDVRQVKSFVDDNPSLVEAASFAVSNAWAKRYMRSSVSTFILWLWWGRQSEIKMFFDKLKNGDGLSVRSPILLLRNRLQDLASQTGQKSSSKHICALTQKAMIAYMDGSPMRLLRLNSNENTVDLYKRNALSN